MKLSSGSLIDDLERWQKVHARYLKDVSYSKNSIEIYIRAINWFIEYMRGYDEELSIENIKPYHITSYFNFLEEEATKRRKTTTSSQRHKKALSTSSKATYKKGVASFFNFISTNNDEKIDFEEILKKSKTREKEEKEEGDVEYLDDQEMQRVLQTLERRKRKRNNYINNRNALLVKLMRFAGLRISEALHVRLCDFEEVQIDHTAYKIKILAKGGNYQTAYIKKEYIEDELEYFKACNELSDGDEVMITRNNTTLKRETAYLIVKQIFIDSSVRKTGLHILRHSLAMNMVRENINVLKIKKRLRHKNISSTQVYARATEEDVLNTL